MYFMFLLVSLHTIIAEQDLAVKKAAPRRADEMRQYEGDKNRTKLGNLGINENS